EEPAAGTAALALVEEQAEVGAFDCGIEVGVGKDYVRALAAQLQADALEVTLGGGFHDELAREVFTGESDLFDVHMAADGSAGSGPKSGDDIDHAVGDARFLCKLGDAQGGERRLLRRFQNNGAAGRQGRAPFPGLHEQREVPRNDLPDYANGFVACVTEIRAFNGDGLAVDLVGPAGIVTIALDGQ